MKDNRGTEIEVGQTVAYNFSGELAIGVVEKIVKGRGPISYDKHVFHKGRKLLK